MTIAKISLRCILKNTFSIFAYLEKASNDFDHRISLKQLASYGLPEMSNKPFNYIAQETTIYFLLVVLTQIYLIF